MKTATCRSAKIAYASRVSAQRAANALRRRTGADKRVYECGCGNWHITSQERRR